MNFLIRNGMVYDPETGRTETREIAAADGVICDRLPEGKTMEINAAGMFVTTGLIDYHVHFYNHGSENGVNPDACSFPCGITTAVDAGTCGAGTFEGYYRSVVSLSDVRILNMLLIASGGQSTEIYPERPDVKYIDREKIKRLFREYPDNLVAIKTRLSKNIITGQDAEDSLRETVRLAEEIGVPVVVHASDPGIPSERIASLLRPGDVFCHCFHGKGETILDENGKIRPGILEARKRGVLFDEGNGRTNSDLEVGKAALMQGFFPDIISSDVNAAAFYLQPLHSLPRIMSKFLDMGMTLEDILKTVTAAPASLIRRKDLASLKAGTAADICIFRVKEKEVPYSDYAGHTLTGHRVIVPQLTMKGGRVMYCQADFM